MLVQQYNNQQGGTEKTEQEGDEGTAIVAATMEEESEDIEVGVRMKGRLLLLSGRKNETEDESGGGDLRRREDSRGSGGRGGGGRGDRGRGAE